MDVPILGLPQDVAGALPPEAVVKALRVSHEPAACFGVTATQDLKDAPGPEECLCCE